MHIGYGVTKKRYNRELEFRFRLGDTAAFAFPYITMENPQNAASIDQHLFNAGSFNYFLISRFNRIYDFHFRSGDMAVFSFCQQKPHKLNQHLSCSKMVRLLAPNAEVPSSNPSLDTILFF